MLNKLFVHERNLLGKIEKNYNRLGNQISLFYKKNYKPVQEALLKIHFDKSHPGTFKKATVIFNEYYNKLKEFSVKNKVTSQSKFESSFLEELSVYLFYDLEEIKSNEFGFFNKGIFAGLKLNSQKQIDIVKKDVDFCIGKRCTLSIDDEKTIDIILSVVCVEVKTYLDATMLGEIKSSSRALKSASPNTQLFTLIGYRNIADEHLIAAKQEALISEIFCLRKEENSDIDSETIYNYWHEVSQAIKLATADVTISSPGRLFYPEKNIKP